jgi:hypothetical protein
MILANGNITPQMHEAGCIFRTLFRSAALESIATSQLIPLASATGGEKSGKQIDARRRVANAIDALDGHDSPAGSCVWFVVWLEFSVREWAMRQGWARRTWSSWPAYPGRRLRNAGHAFRALASAVCGVTPPRWAGRDPVPSLPGSLYAG